MKALEKEGSIALLAGGFCFFLALGVIVLAPAALTDQDDPVVVGVDSVRRDVRPYTAQEQRGRDVYGTQICWHCHSQYVRPVAGEERRWGPVSQTGEYAHDVPHFFSTRRVGPDLHREGGLRVDDWHLAHLFDPRFTVSRSIMPAFTWLFVDPPHAARSKDALARYDTNGDGVVSGKIGDDSLSGEPLAEVKALDVRGVRPPRLLHEEPGDPIRWREGPDSPDGILTDYDHGPRPTQDAEDVVAYLQRLGTNIGRWRRPLYVTAPPRISPFAEADPRPRAPGAARLYGAAAGDKKRADEAAEARRKHEAAVADWDRRWPHLARRLADGKQAFEKHCAACHGDEGRGNGLAAPFLLVRPRDFTVGKYSYRSTDFGQLPTDGDLYRSIWRGLPGTAMPSWRELPDEQIWLLVDYVKSLFEGDKQFNDRDWILPAPPPRTDPDPANSIRRGRAVYLALQCANCHGVQGMADAPGWDDTTSDWGGRFRPRDLRPRLEDAWAPELYVLLGRMLEQRLGTDAWAKIAEGPAWKALDPTDPQQPAKRTAFVRLLLGMGPRLLDAIGGEAVVKPAMGDEAWERVFGVKHDPLEDVRMAVATEKDQPALRYRGGAAPEDVYRTIMGGIDGKGMKATWGEFWTKERTPSVATPGARKRDAPVRWVFKDKDKDGGPNRQGLFVHVLKGQVLEYLNAEGREKWKQKLEAEPEMASIGVYARTVKNDKGEDVEQSAIDLQVGDDWALVHYVLWLSCIPIPRAGD
jgi:cytochrome c oxidase cbb3-type subunit 2